MTISVERNQGYKYIFVKISFIAISLTFPSGVDAFGLSSVCMSDLYAEPSYQFKIGRYDDDLAQPVGNQVVGDGGEVGGGEGRRKRLNVLECKVLDKQPAKGPGGKEKKKLQSDLDKVASAADDEAANLAAASSEQDVESRNPPKDLIITSEADALEKAIELIQDIPCLTFQMEQDVWSYTFCDGEIVQSVSEEAMVAYGLSPAEVENIKYITGRQSEDQSFKLSKRAGDGTFFLQQSFPNGDRKLCAKNRESVIIYSCNEEEESILSFDEFSICLYHMKIGTPRLCVHPYFKVPVEDNDESSSHILDCSVQSPSPLYFFNYINFMCKGLECLVPV